MEKYSTELYEKCEDVVVGKSSNLACSLRFYITCRNLSEAEMPRETTLKGLGVLNRPVVIASLQAVKGVSKK